MSYARWGVDGSQVYVFAHADGWIECHGCLLLRTPDAEPDFRAQSPWAMALHLAEHRGAGHAVPDHAIARLREESTARPMLARLLAAGYEQAELALRVTADDPHPSYVFIGYFRNERIGYIQVAGEEDDLPRIEAAVLEKLEAAKKSEAEKAGRQRAGLETEIADITARILRLQSSDDADAAGSMEREIESLRKRRDALENRLRELAKVVS